MHAAIFTNSETLEQIFRLSNRKPLNKYFWLKEIAETVEYLSRVKDIPKANILVEDLSEKL